MASSGIAAVVVAGNITRDPELNQTGRVLGFGVAVNRREKDQDGSYVDAVSFFDIKVLGNRAEALAKILVKGEKVTVQGELVQERWETDDGQKRSTVRILAREVVLSGSPRGDITSSSDTPAESKSDDNPGW